MRQHERDSGFAIVACPAAFVAAGSVGIAAGPLLSSVMTAVPPTRLGFVTLDSVTLGGWAMAVIWAVFLVVVALRFEDPLLKCAQRRMPAPLHAVIALSLVVSHGGVCFLLMCRGWRWGGDLFGSALVGSLAAVNTIRADCFRWGTSLVLLLVAI